MNAAYIWPIALIILSNTVYQICAKAVPDAIDPLVALIVTYLTSAVLAVILYFVLNKDADLFGELKKVNWASFVLGLVLIGLDIGFIYAYKVGWQVNTASIVQNSVLTVLLAIVGYFLYHEQLTPTKLLGMAICMVGVYFLNK